MRSIEPGISRFRVRADARPGMTAMYALRWVPALRSSARCAAPRPGHDANSRRPKPRLRQRRAALLRRQRLKKRLHGGASFARGYQREIVMFFGKGNEAEAGGVGDRSDGHAPIGAMLRHGGGHRVMRTRLVPVAVGTRGSEQ